MATIYENSFITIAATRSGDSNQGCFGTNTPLSQGIELDSSKLWVCEQTLDDFPLTDFALLHENGDWPTPDYIITRTVSFLFEVIFVLPDAEILMHLTGIDAKL